MRPFGNGPGVRSIDAPAPALVRTSRERPYRGYLAKPSHKDPIPVHGVPNLTQAQTAALQGFPDDWDWGAARSLRSVDQMIVNAVPVAVAESIGRVILSRHAGESLPEIERAFSEWLKNSKGLVGQVLRNKRHALGRARRLLGGRLYADVDEELQALEAAEEFVHLAASTRSDLRAAIRAHAEWRTIAAKKAIRKPPQRLPEC